jgi:kynureninase
MKKYLTGCLLLLSFLFIEAGWAEEYQDEESFAIECDEQDSLSHFRKQFFIPKDKEGTSQIYLCGHSLGLQPKTVQEVIQAELDAWANLGVDGHFKQDSPWYTYQEFVRDSLARLVGAKPEEVVAMNSLTVNLHLMMVSFYRPTPNRYKILMEAPVFSSDTYAAKSQIAFHGYDADNGLVIVAPREIEDCLRIEDIEQLLENSGDEIALVLLSAVNYFNGQKLNLNKITKKAHEKGCLVGFDLAHAIGNVPLFLHEANVDFAAWCSYKYLNSGPGAIGGVFVHERHLSDPNLNRFAGWWGNDPNTRFQLHLQPDFIPVQSADSWQISNPSIFALAPLIASLEIFDKAGMLELHKKAVRLTGFLEFLIQRIDSEKISLITPSNPDERGCMLSIRVDDQPELLMEVLHQNGIVCDFRRPNVLRITPIPLYNTFHEVWQFGYVLKSHLER